jgi:hypothetical protein
MSIRTKRPSGRLDDAAQPPLGGRLRAEQAERRELHGHAARHAVGRMGLEHAQVLVHGRVGLRRVRDLLAEHVDGGQQPLVASRRTVRRRVVGRRRPRCSGRDALDERRGANGSVEDERAVGGVTALGPYPTGRALSRRVVSVPSRRRRGRVGVGVGFGERH